MERTVNEYYYFPYVDYQEHSPSLSYIVGGFDKFMDFDNAMKGTKKQQQNYDWEQFDRKKGIETHLSKIAMYYHPHYKDITNPYYSDNRQFANDYAKNGGTSNIIWKDEFDKQWRSQNDMEKILRQTDIRPLHRKGCLNRVFDE